MQTLYNSLKNKSLIYCSIVCSALLISCGSYQHTQYSDGIYTPNPNDSNYNAEQMPQSNRQVVQNTSKDGDYYQNYFAEQGQQISEAQQYNSDEEIFTDVDSYSSENIDDSDAEEIIYEEDAYYFNGNAGWGSNPTTVEVNFINTGFNNPYLYGGYNWGGFSNPRNNSWGGNYYVWWINGLGWNNYYPYNNWNIGLGWGGYYRPWGGGFYGNYNPYYHHYYNNNYHNSPYRRSYANSGRSNYNTYRTASATRSNYSRSNSRSNSVSRNTVTRKNVRNSSNLNAKTRSNSTSIRSTSNSKINSTKTRSGYYNNSTRTNTSTRTTIPSSTRTYRTTSPSSTRSSSGTQKK